MSYIAEQNKATNNEWLKKHQTNEFNRNIVKKIYLPFEYGSAAHGHFAATNSFSHKIL